MSGSDWCYGVLKCQLLLSVRTPQATRLSRAVRFNRPQVGEFSIGVRKHEPSWLDLFVGHDTESPVEQVKGTRLLFVPRVH